MIYSSSWKDTWVNKVEFENRVLTLERIYKRPNPHYVRLTTGEIVLLELELADGSFICTPEYFQFMQWPHKDEATIEDVWEKPIKVKSTGSGFQYNPDDALSMLDPMNVDNYRNGKW